MLKLFTVVADFANSSSLLENHKERSSEDI